MKRLQSISTLVMALFYLIAGANHFLNPLLYLPIMPAWLPWPLELIYLSGVAEMVLGGGLLLPRYRYWAALGVIALLIAVFPANVEMLLHAQRFPQIPVWVLWARLPFQAVLIAWAYSARGPRPLSVTSP